MQHKSYGTTTHHPTEDALPEVPTCAVQEETLTGQKAELAYPSMYKVLLLNDDYTPMDFVVFILERFFAKSPEEAHTIMLEVHNRGSGVCGIFTYEIAETKIGQVMDLAQQNQHPLQCTLEKA